MMQQFKEEVIEVSQVEPGYDDHAEKDNQILQLPIKEETSAISEGEADEDKIAFIGESKNQEMLLPKVEVIEGIETKTEEEEEEEDIKPLHQIEPFSEDQIQVFLQETDNHDLSVSVNSKCESNYEEVRNLPPRDSINFVRTCSQSERQQPFHDYNQYFHEDEHHKSNMNMDDSDKITQGAVFDDISFPCRIVGGPDYHKQDAKRTMTAPESIDPFQCQICCKCFSRKNKLKRHIMSAHTINRRYQCETCSKTFPYKSSFDRHLLTHTTYRPYQCEICSKSFTQKSNLDKHLIIHTTYRPYQCEICSKSFALESDLTRHSILHADNHPYQCEVCSKSFAVKSNLGKHVITHTDNRPYQCEICSKSFNRKGNLESHMIITHSTNRPYQCDVCSKSFAVKSNLAKHGITHTDNRPYQCEMCNKSFTQKSNLNRHMAAHTNNRPYQCEICSKSFTQKGRLDTHLITHTINHPYEEVLSCINYATC